MAYFLIALSDEFSHGTHLCHHHPGRGRTFAWPGCSALSKSDPPKRCCSHLPVIVHFVGCHVNGIIVYVRESVVFLCYPFMILPCHFFIVIFYCTYHNLSLFHCVYTNFSSTGHTRYFLFLLLAFYLKGFTSEHSFILRYISQ